MKRLPWLVLALLVAALTTLSFANRAAHAAPVEAPVKPSPSAAPVDTLAMLERAVAKDSTKFDKVYALGVAYMDRERMSEATTLFLKANQLQPKNAKVLVNLGIAVDALGHPDDAQGFYARALALAPNDTLASCRMASSKYAQGKYDDAMTMLRGIIAKTPGAHCAYFELGVAFADAGIYRDAIRMWRKVVELAPTSPEAVSAKESMDVLEKFLAGK